ncbi:MAG: hypothetical protein AABZ08_10710 [Planctomycetota bacterium]
MSIFAGLCSFLSELATALGGIPLLGGFYAFVVNAVRGFPLLGCQ